MTLLKGEIMTIIFTTKQEKFIEQQIQTGKYATVNEVISSALFFYLIKKILINMFFKQEKYLKKLLEFKKMVKNKNIPFDVDKKN